MVAKRLGYDPHRAGEPLVVDVRLKRGERGIEGAIDWTAVTRKRAGERRFISRNQDCEELAATMGFVLAVQIQLMATEPEEKPPSEGADQDRAKDTSAGDGAPSSERKLDTPEVPAVRTSAEPEPGPDAARWTGIAGLGPSVGFGLGPGPIAVGDLVLAVQRGSAMIALGAEVSLPSTKRQDYGGGFRHEFFLGSLALCAQRWSLSACGLAKLGLVQVHGVGVDDPLSPSGFLAQAGPRLGYSLGLGNRFSLLGRVEVLYLLTPRDVDVNHTTVWTMPRIGAVAGMDVAVRLW
jgi:hypothetical protein